MKSLMEPNVQVTVKVFLTAPLAGLRGLMRAGHIVERQAGCDCVQLEPRSVEANSCQGSGRREGLAGQSRCIDCHRDEI